MVDMLTVRAAPHPLSQSWREIEMPAGLTISEMLAFAQPKAALLPAAYVFINGEAVSPDRWNSIRPKPGAQVVLKVVPQGGGGGKNPLRTVLSIAVVLAAPMLGPALGASLGISSSLTVAGVNVASAIGGGIISVAGSLLVNAIAPAPKQKLSGLSSGSNRTDSPTLFIEGARNEKRPFQPVPRLLGWHRHVPPMAADVYTESSGGNQYVRQLFIQGYGPLDISDRRIGETALENYDEVEIQTDTGNSGLPPSLSLYPNDASQIDLNIALTYPGGWQTQTTDLNADEIVVDYTFPAGLYRFDDFGKKQSRTAVIEARYAPTGTTAWVPLGAKTHKLAATNAQRFSFKANVTRGQYDVQLRKNSPDATDDQTTDDCYWTSLKTFTNIPPINIGGIAAEAIRIKATDQLNGAVDQYSSLNKVIAKDYDYVTGTWVTRITNNPASLFRLALQDTYANGSPVPDNKIMLDVLESWHDFCRIKGLAFNAMIDYETSLEEVLQDIAAAGRGRPHKLDDKFTVVIDREQTVVRQLITPRNSWDYEFERIFPDVPHALRCDFINERIDYQRDERIVFADGYTQANATLYEGLQFYGVTNPDQVWKMAREYLATLVHRGVSHRFSCDYESLTCTKGDLIHFQHDVALAGVGSGRILSVEDDGAAEPKAVAIFIDEDITLYAGELYGVRIRLKDGTFLVKPINTIAGTSNRLEFDTPFLLDPLIDGDLGSLLDADNLVAIGTRSRITMPLVIKEIERGPNYTARVTALDAAPEIYLASSGAVPPFTSGTYLPPALRKPLPPIIRETQMGRSVMVRSMNGQYTARLVITLENGNAAPVMPVVLIRQNGDTDYTKADVVLADPERVVLEGLDDQTRYDIQIAFQQQGGSALTGTAISDFTLLNNFLFEADPGPPDDVAELKLTVAGATIVLAWQEVTNIDLRDYQIRHTPEIGAVSWPGASIRHKEVRGSSIPTPFQLGTYLIKARDYSGQYSLNAATVSVAFSDVLNANVVELIDEGPGFTGAKTNVGLVTGGLVLTDASLMEGIYELAAVTDLGEVFNCRLLPAVTARGYVTSELMSNWTSLASLAAMASPEPTDWEATLEIKTTLEDPASGSAVWSAWRELSIGEYQLRGAKYRLMMRSGAANISPLVQALQITVDMPDRTEADQDVVVPSAGLYVPFTPAFRVVPAVVATANNGMSGDRQTLVATESGFTIQFFNSSGSAVSRTVNWIAKGYGRQI